VLKLIGDLPRRTLAFWRRLRPIKILSLKVSLTDFLAVGFVEDFMMRFDVENTAAKAVEVGELSYDFSKWRENQTEDFTHGVLGLKVVMAMD